mmetsp:Transcript_13846/g.20964  ORF Transcript_13846/g.20964 Transcript_13846/m.20964 type:complete len:185 (+) Transcript_13846:22-576(+)|eukprot:CAMPEP_0117427308 /NCGR_PEP_ID=MMETSP0758-20121206/7184_1 /TAXON_ID=63605 /ORGANISM="Percolomonas cosmopolitus, Strain AE-1 (ATCC 50343)" /LENGTH=184 /DNA_ID=CAMNT_0005212871 /DNA_START=17 /DNA_END=571 /DNA_ORIENTATION=+
MMIRNARKALVNNAKFLQATTLRNYVVESSVHRPFDDSDIEYGTKTDGEVYFEQKVFDEKVYEHFAYQQYFFPTDQWKTETAKRVQRTLLNEIPGVSHSNVNDIDLSPLLNIDVIFPTHEECVFRLGENYKQFMEDFYALCPEMEPAALDKLLALNKNENIKLLVERGDAMFKWAIDNKKALSM